MLQITVNKIKILKKKIKSFVLHSRMLGETLVLFCLIAKCTRVDIMFEQTIINFEMRNVHVPVHNLKIKIEVTFYYV
jgi:hypothetical protein